LLYGSVIICSRSVEGRLMGLTALDHQQLQSSSRLARRRLQWRFARAQRRGYPTIAGMPAQKNSRF
jgi:hypothetical protein